PCRGRVRAARRRTAGLLRRRAAMAALRGGARHRAGAPRPRFHRPLVDPRRLRGFPTVPRDRAAAHGRTGHRSGGGKRGREMTDHDRAAPTAQALAEVIALHPGAADPAPDAGAAPAEGLPERVSAALEFLRRRLTGEYEVDDFGFDPD